MQLGFVQFHGFSQPTVGPFHSSRCFSLIRLLLKLLPGVHPSGRPQGNSHSHYSRMQSWSPTGEQGVTRAALDRCREPSAKCDQKSQQQSPQGSGEGQRGHGASQAGGGKGAGRRPPLRNRRRALEMAKGEGFPDTIRNMEQTQEHARVHGQCLVVEDEKMGEMGEREN